MKTKSVLILSFLFIATLLSAQDADSLRTERVGEQSPTKAMADSAYAQERYDDATRIYLELVQSEGESAQIYYNLGNCYYRQDSIARAVLFYERALLLNPADADVRFNLDMARSKTVDRVAIGSEMFFVTTWRSLVLSLSMQHWAQVALASFLLMLIGVAVYLFSPRLRSKKVGFVAAIILLIVCAVANIAAYTQRQHITRRTGAVIMAPSVVVKSTPSTSGTDLFILHEGTRVDIVDDTMRDWLEVRLSDGKQGWLQRAEIEVI